MRSPAKAPLFVAFSLLALSFVDSGRVVVSAQTDAVTQPDDDFASNAFLALPPYRPVDALKGTVRIAGSNTVGDVAAIWKVRFEKYYPDVKVELASQGTVTGIAALKAGKVDIAAASTRISKESLPKATQLVVCTDMLGIYVAKDNPVEALTVSQLKSLFGKPAVKTWSDVGVQGEWGKKSVAVISRDASSGSHGYFQEVVLQGEDYRKDAVSTDSNSNVVAKVAATPGAIGYAGLAFQRTGVRLVPIAKDEMSDAVAPDADKPGIDYALRRPLTLVTRGKPQGPALEFIKYALSRQGQQDAAIAGVLPLASSVVRHQLERAGVEVIR